MTAPEHAKRDARAAVRDADRDAPESQTGRGRSTRLGRSPAPVAGLAAGPAIDPLGGTPAAPNVVETLRRRQGGGHPLPAALAGGFGEQLGTDLSTVRVHTDAEAGRVAQEVQASAFTYGADIYFGTGTYSPGTTSGQRLIAHELAHVVQHASGTGSTAAGPIIGRADDPSERDADRVAHDLLSGMRTSASRSAPAGVQRSVIRRNKVADLKSKFEASNTQANTPQAPVGTGNKPASANAKQRFDDAVSSGGAPTDAVEAATRMAELRKMLTRMSRADRQTISTDAALMAKARVYVGPKEYMSLVTAVGMFYRSPVANPDEVDHMSGGEADTFIQTEMAKRGHLAAYITAAVKAGKKAEGFVATVSQDDWMKVREVQYAGQGDNVNTNAFIANQHSDRPAIIHHARGTRSTAVHESMHRYSELNILNTWGAPLNEGTTEYFTRLIVNDDGSAVPLNGVSSRTPYRANFEFIRDRLLPILGPNRMMREVALAEIYFNGKTELLKAKFEAAHKKAGTAEADIPGHWTAFEAAIKAGSWATAAGELP
jgi:hypothetical protein